MLTVEDACLIMGSPLIPVLSHTDCFVMFVYSEAFVCSNVENEYASMQIT